LEVSQIERDVLPVAAKVRWRRHLPNGWQTAWYPGLRLPLQRGPTPPCDPFALSVPMEQSMESSLQVILRQAAAREQRPFIILGFLTGLGLSAVIGAVLYVFLTLG
jgi:hypothetical protein